MENVLYSVRALGSTGHTSRFQLAIAQMENRSMVR